jgi:ATP-dependent DNA helicase PIF1
MSKSITKQGTKRKSQGALPDARSAKQPKLTIDSFFSRKVSVRIGSGLDGVAADAKEKVHDVMLSDEQVKVFKMVVEEGKNVFFTGSAGTFLPLPFFLCISFPGERSDADAAGLLGTGKSLLLKAIITALKKKHASKPEVVSVTASTGMAASNIGGALR